MAESNQTWNTHGEKRKSIREPSRLVLPRTEVANPTVPAGRNASPLLPSLPFLLPLSPPPFSRGIRSVRYTRAFRPIEDYREIVRKKKREGYWSRGESDSNAREFRLVIYSSGYDIRTFWRVDDRRSKISGGRLIGNGNTKLMLGNKFYMIDGRIYSLK